MSQRFAATGSESKHLFGAALLALGGVVATWDVWVDVVRVALRDPGAFYILLVPAVSLRLAWVRRRRLAFCQAHPSYLGPVLVAAGVLAHLGGLLHPVATLWYAGALLIVIGCFVAVAGKDPVLRFLPAIVVLGFLVPLPAVLRQEISFLLEDAFAPLTAFLLEVLGASVELSGGLLRMGVAEVAVGGGAAGLGMALLLIVFSYGFAFDQPFRPPVRSLILTLSPFFLVLGNVARSLVEIGVANVDSLAAHGWITDLTLWAMLPLQYLLLAGTIRLLRWSAYPVRRYNLACD